MAKFDPASYSRYRVDYPPELFHSLKPLLASPPGPCVRVLDLGAGTGIASRSLSALHPGRASFHLVDPDPEMLSEAGATLGPEVDFTCEVGSGEDFGSRNPVDLVLIGSAWHWMKPERVLERLEQVLRIGGRFLVFEYQFPKGIGAEALPLNDWIRREFNRVWKDEGQRPRGSLLELLQPVLSHPAFAYRGEVRLEQNFELSPEALQGVILSQSRYLSFERTLNAEKRLSARQELLERIRGFYGTRSSLGFEYRFQSVGFERRPG